MYWKICKYGKLQVFHTTLFLIFYVINKCEFWVNAGIRNWVQWFQVYWYLLTLWEHLSSTVCCFHFLGASLQCKTHVIYKLPDLSIFAQQRIQLKAISTTQLAITTLIIMYSFVWVPVHIDFSTITDTNRKNKEKNPQHNNNKPNKKENNPTIGQAQLPWNKY